MNPPERERRAEETTREEVPWTDRWPWYSWAWLAFFLFPLAMFIVLLLGGLLLTLLPRR